MDSPPSLAKSSQKSRVEKFVQRVISPAVVDKTCPICLRNLDSREAAVLTVCSHAYCLECIRKWSDLKRKCPLCNSTFDSWFYRIHLCSRKFLKQQLPALSDGKSIIPPGPTPRSTFTNRRRIIERAREELNIINWRPSPRRRTFGQPGTVPPHVIDERKLQWRASVYRRRLQAIPVSPRISFEPNVATIDCVKERIKPWIRRELEAILGDPDPSIILHVVLSVFFSRHERKLDGSSGQVLVEDDFLAPLKPFLHNWTNMFWHELSCFADSPFNVETYDEVVHYRSELE